MQGGNCSEHGNPQGIPDLRLKIVLDDGITAQNVLCNQEMTEMLTGINIDVAKAMATDAFSADVVSEKMVDMLVGMEYAMSGQVMGDKILAESVTPIVDAPTKQMIKALIEEAM